MNTIEQNKIGLFAKVGLLFLLVLTLVFPPLTYSQPAPLIIHLVVTGHIDPLQADYLKRGLKLADSEQAECVILQLNTPGGLDESMREMVQEIIASPVPVVIYIGPSGARAASAGVFITLAAPFKTMAPETNLGAAHPVDLSGNKASDKITNDAAALIRSLAQKNNKNQKILEEMVRQSISLTSQEAFKSGIIDMIVSDFPSLLINLDGKKIKLTTGKSIILHTRGAQVREFSMSWKENLLHNLANPNIAYIFMLIGVYGLIYELASPGAIVPGVVGSICLILAFMSFSNLPLNLAGFLLVILALVLFIVDIKASTHGVLTAGGMVALFLGSSILFNPAMPEYRLSLVVIYSVVVVTTLFFLFAVRSVYKAQKGKVRIGSEILIGAQGVAVTDIMPHGIVRIAGENWNAYSEITITKDSKISVEGRDGFMLKVKKN